MPPPTQRWMRSVGDREGPDGQGELEVAVRVDGAERPHRRAAADGLEQGDMVDGRDLGTARDRSAREESPEQLGEPDTGPEHALDGRDELADARQPVLGHELGPAHRPRTADP